MEGMDWAICGLIRQFGKPFPLYSKKRILWLLMTRDGMSPCEAEEFFGFNIEGAWVGKETPFILEDC